MLPITHKRPFRTSPLPSPPASPTGPALPGYYPWPASGAQRAMHPLQQTEPPPPPPVHDKDRGSSDDESLSLSDSSTVDPMIDAAPKPPRTPISPHPAGFASRKTVAIRSPPTTPGPDGMMAMPASPAISQREGSLPSSHRKPITLSSSAGSLRHSGHPASPPPQHPLPVRPSGSSAMSSHGDDDAASTIRMRLNNEGHHHPLHLADVPTPLEIRRPSVGIPPVDGHHQDSLASWAPNQSPSNNAPQIANLPHWSTVMGQHAPPPFQAHHQNAGLAGYAPSTASSIVATSLPNNVISADLDYSFRRLLNEQLFEALLDEPLGRMRFREWLVSYADDRSVAKVDAWLDLRTWTRLAQTLKSGSMALHDLYLANGSPQQVQIPGPTFSHLFSSLRSLVAVDASPFDSAQAHLLRSLYDHEFQRFVRNRVVETARIRLGRFDLNAGEGEKDGLGDCSCLTNPRLRDHPIVLTSPGFERVTGYPRESIVGRNCRFLQGPGTSPQGVQRIRDCLNAGETCTELLLNYRRDGTPFWCLLNIIPLRDTSGYLTYFIGGQVNVTSLLSGTSNVLSFLIADADDGPSQTLATDRLAAGAGAGEFGNTRYALSPSFKRFCDPASSSSHPEASDAASVSQFNGFGGGGGGKRTANKTAAGSVFADGDVSKDGVDGGLGLSMGSKSAGSKRKKRGLFGGAGAGGQGGAGSGKKRREEENEAMFEDMQRAFGGQKLVGAEATFDQSLRIEDQIKVFEATYSKLLIFRKEKREIIFATRALLSFLELPMAEPKHLYHSPLIHGDFIRMLVGTAQASSSAGSGQTTEAVRETVKAHIRAGRAMSQRSLIRGVGKSKILGRETTFPAKMVAFHMTPLLERDGQTVAFAVVVA